MGKLQIRLTDNSNGCLNVYIDDYDIINRQYLQLLPNQKFASLNPGEIRPVPSYVISKENAKDIVNAFLMGITETDDDCKIKDCSKKIVKVTMPENSDMVVIQLEELNGTQNDKFQISQVAAVCLYRQLKDVLRIKADSNAE